jgi:hypothetical protein
MEYSIFALELAARTSDGDPLREALYRLVIGDDGSADRRQKAERYTRAAALLAAELSRVDRGCWDYFDDHHRAVTDFAMWSDGMLGEEGARTEPSSPGQERYLIFTMAFLLARGSGSDRRLAERCQLEDDELWQRSSFAQMLENVALIDFADVRADIAYLIPGDEAYALTARDLERGKFDHLRRVE